MVVAVGRGQFYEIKHDATGIHTHSWGRVYRGGTYDDVEVERWIRLVWSRDRRAASHPAAIDPLRDTDPVQWAFRHFAGSSDGFGNAGHSGVIPRSIVPQELRRIFERSRRVACDPYLIPQGAYTLRGTLALCGCGVEPTQYDNDCEYFCFSCALEHERTTLLGLGFKPDQVDSSIGRFGLLRTHPLGA